MGQEKDSPGSRNLMSNSFVSATLIQLVLLKGSRLFSTSILLASFRRAGKFDSAQAYRNSKT